MTRLSKFLNSVCLFILIGCASRPMLKTSKIDFLDRLPIGSPMSLADSVFGAPQNSFVTNYENRTETVWVINDTESGEIVTLHFDGKAMLASKSLQTSGASNLKTISDVSRRYIIKLEEEPRGCTSAHTSLTQSKIYKSTSDKMFVAVNNDTVSALTWSENNWRKVSSEPCSE